MIHDSEHWTSGGTGLTNFPPEDFPRFRRALAAYEAAYGSNDFCISETRMLGPGRNYPGGSLHKLRETSNSSAFWRIFEKTE